MPEQPLPLMELPPTAESHFRLHFYTAVLCALCHRRRLSGLAAHALASEPFAFLEVYERQLRPYLPEKVDGPEALARWQLHTRRWEERTDARLPLRELMRRLGLTPEERLMLLLAGLVEEDIRFGSLFAALQEPLPARRPCLGLVGALAAEVAEPHAPRSWWHGAHRLMDAGLLVAENRDAPRAEWVLRVPQCVWDALRGRPLIRSGSALSLQSKREFPPLKRLALEASLRARLLGLPALVAREGELGAVLLRGMENSGRRTVMGSLARSLRRDLLFYDGRVASGEKEEAWSALGPLALLTGAFPVVALDPAPGETVELQPLKGYRGTVGVVLRREGGVRSEWAERAVSLDLAAPAPAHRQAVWLKALGAQAGHDLDTIVGRFLLPLGNVERAARIASTYARAERRASVTVADVQLACRCLNRQKLDTLAQRLQVGGGWPDLIVNDATAAELTELERRCCHRERLLSHLGVGFRDSVNTGVRALFNGPSGTGKTLAAKTLAAVLRMDVYRVDLSAVVNKYVGETEKNLSQLLARAEELDVILLFDEGDALMTNRTDVKSANDRYANLETNYLLQRLESYQGIIVVTTNAGKRIDTAFQRRFDIVVDFQPPDSDERLLIWRRHLPRAHRVSAPYLCEVAHHCVMTGGQIRNAALHAALLAAAAGRDGRVEDADLEASVQREYRKAGASFPLRLQAGPDAGGGRQSALKQFLLEIN